MGSNPSREIPLLGIAHPFSGPPFSSIEDALGDGMHFGALEAKKWPNRPSLVFFLYKLWARDPFLYKLSLNTIVYKFFLYKKYYLGCMDVQALLGRFTHVRAS